MSSRTDAGTDPRHEYEPILREALRLYPALLTKPPMVREGYQRVAQLAHGWYLRCHRGVEAILTLDAAGFAEEASPIRRSVIEHCLALRWLAMEGDAVFDPMSGAHAHSSQQRHDAIAAAGWTSVDLDQIREIVAKANPPERDRSSDHLTHWQQRLAKYGDKHDAPGYLAETARSHPSLDSAACYLDKATGDLLWSSRDAVAQVAFCTNHLLEALVCIREIFDPAPWEDELKRMMETFRSVTDTVRRHDGLAPIDWATGTVKGE